MKPKREIIPNEKITELAGGRSDRLLSSTIVSVCALCARMLYRKEVGGEWFDGTCEDGASDGLEGHCSGTPGEPGPKHQAVHDLPDMGDRDDVERWLDEV